ncbi:hypothetical protein [Rhodopirellula sallentina]|uniref:Secreted protein n=1 Tax=Rhodopirellula sallentina SM41 TaxID=1263870 RepID=M5TWM7_9BACT|nr:hypothetical protein [Rhodopirellula sallentina]EMI53439.1 secreted protein [Rhodopirellula sallentina SM41]
MNKTLSRICCSGLLLGALVAIGCEGNTGIVEPPEMTAEDKAALEARQAEYSKSMAEAYGKK